MWNLRNETKEQKKKETNKKKKTTLLNTKTKLVAARGMVDGRMGKIEKGDQKYT